MLEGRMFRLRACNHDQSERGGEVREVRAVSVASVAKGAVCVCCPGGAGGRAHVVSPPEVPHQRPSPCPFNRRPRMCVACVHMGRRGKGDHAAHMLPRCISGDALLSKLIPLAANEAGVRGAEQGSGGWAVESVHLPQSLGLATPASRSGA